jgi:hypothetical protein
MCFSQLLGLGQHAAALELGRCQDDLGTQEAQNLATLEAEAFGHRQHQRVALGSANHGQADAGIATGGLDDGLARAQ